MDDSRDSSLDGCPAMAVGTNAHVDDIDGEDREVGGELSDVDGEITITDSTTVAAFRVLLEVRVLGCTTVS